MNAIEKYRRNPTPIEAAKLVAREKYAWPGGYPLILVMDDGAALCPDCVRSEFRRIAYSTRNGLRDGWRAAGYQIEECPDEDERCAHCAKVISEL